MKRTPTNDVRPIKGTSPESAETKIRRLEKQVRRWRQKNTAANAEIERLEKHVERGRGLLHQVTSEIGGKQLERDLATARLEAAMNMMVCLMVGAESVYIPLDTFRAVIGKKRLDMEQVDGGYQLKIVDVTEENGGGADGETADAVPPLVPAQDQGNDAGQSGEAVQAIPEPGVPADQ